MPTKAKKLKANSRVSAHKPFKVFATIMQTPTGPEVFDIFLDRCGACSAAKIVDELRPPGTDRRASVVSIKVPQLLR